MLNDLNLKAITVMISAKCNLNCNFCFLHKNTAFLEYDKIIQDAWKNFTYIKNLEKVLNKLKVDTTNISHITIWGGEPFLDTKNFNENIPQLFQLFPNWEKSWTSTNFNINVSNIVELLQKIDEYTKKPFTFRIQISMDGPYYKEGHNVSKEIYKQKIKELMDILNQIYFKNLTVIFNFRATIDEETYLSDFTDKTNINTFFNYCKDLQDFFKRNIFNKKIFLDEDSFIPTPSYPSYATTEDGLTFNKIIRSWSYINNQKYQYELYQALGHITNNKYLFTKNNECGNLYKNLTIGPDGGITCCSNAFISNFQKYENIIKEENNLLHYSELKQEKNYVFNPLQMTPREIERIKWSVFNGAKNNYLTFNFLAMHLCQELALSNQIQSKYATDPILLYQHINLLDNIASCMYYNIHETKMPYISSPSTFRKYLNGITDYVIENETKKIKQKENM